MSPARAELGRAAEQAAAEYLLARRHRVLARNVRSPYGEIDLVAVDDGGTVVFVEVRSRTGDRFGSGIDSVDRRKRRRIVRAARCFLAQNRLDDRSVRFDVIGIEWGDGEPRIEHVEAAFDADE